MRVRHAVAGIGVTAAMMIGTALPAMAYTYLEITGAALKVEHGQHRFTLYDTACDDDSVYYQWKTEGGATIKETNTWGCGTNVVDYNGHGSGTKIWFRVCVDKSWPTADKCSAWDWDIWL